MRTDFLPYLGSPNLPFPYLPFPEERPLGIDFRVKTKSYKTFDARLLKPGNFFLVKRPSFIGRCITIGQALRYSSSFNRWNHTGIIIDDQGTIVEAHADGVKQRNISTYDDWGKDLEIIEVNASDEDRQQMVAFARYCAQKHQSYGFVTIACIALMLLTGGRLRFFIKGQQICSGLVARCMERGPFIFDEEPATIMPAYLASFFKVMDAPTVRFSK